MNYFHRLNLLSVGSNAACTTNNSSVAQLGSNNKSHNITLFIITKLYQGKFIDKVKFGAAVSFS